jgi:hypothetical protein
VCSSSCLTCSDGTHCLSCQPNGPLPVLLVDQLACIASSSCPSGYFIDASFGWEVCTGCLAPCLACANASFCLSCQSGVVLKGECKSACPSGYFASSAGECLPCDPSCFRCGASASSCTACAGSAYLKGGRCVVSCGDGYYLDSYIYECFGCVSPCLACASASSCLSCLNSSYLLFQGQCLLSCPGSTYQTNGSCLPCPASCLTCHAPLAAPECLQCAPGMFMTSTVSGQCLDSCGVQEYGDALTAYCFSCLAPCLRCLSAISCLSCTANYLLVSTECLNLTRCPAGLYLLNGECLANCGTLWAVESSAVCGSECLPPALKVEGTWQCLLGCPSDYRVDWNYSCSACGGGGCGGLLGVEVQLKSIFNRLYAKLSFSQAVDLTGVAKGQLSLSVAPVSARLLVPLALNYSVSVANLDAVWLEVAVDSSLKDALLTVTFPDYYLLGEPLQSLSFTAPLSSFELYSQ